MMEPELGHFGDKRRGAVGDALLAAMQRHRTLQLHKLAESRAQTQQFRGFLSCSAVGTVEMMATAGRKTNQRAAGRHVLAIQDTTELHFPTHEASKQGFGKGGNGKDLGLFLHPVLGVDADNGGIIGLIDCMMMNRTGGKVSDRRNRSAEDKESHRWLEGAQIAGERLEAASMITVVADRESDVYDLFAHRPANVHLLCRSAQDRAVADGGLLSQLCDGWPEQERRTIAVPPRPGQAGRQAEVAVRFGAVRLRRPQTPGSRHLPESVDLHVVDVREINPPRGVEPVHWRLLTTHAVSTLAEAHRIIDWYKMRWTIEQVFRSLKTHGLRLEQSQMPQACHFTKLAVIALIAAVRAMQLVLARDGTTGQKLTDALDTTDQPALVQLNATLEGRTEKLKNPYDPASLAWLAWIVARLGGWSGYTSRGYRPPGPKTIHDGLLRLDPILLGWSLANRSADVRLP